MSGKLKHITTQLFQPVDGQSLGLFRIMFGIIMLWEMTYLLRLDFVEIYLHRPQVQFTYDLFHFVKPLPFDLMTGLIWFLMGCCLLIITGKFYRFAMSSFFLGFTYLFLLDQAIYNNHLYLVCLLSFLMIFIRADRCISFGNKHRQDDLKLPFWNIFILRMQLFIVFFYGGIAKINSDWIFHQEPVRIQLFQRAKTSVVSEIITSELFIHLITYGGLVIDLVIGFLLFYRKTRMAAIALALLFNITNMYLFRDINIFPYLMSCALILFADPAWVKRKLQRFGPGKTKPAKRNKQPEDFQINRQISGLLAAYLMIQLLIPVRHLLFDGNVDWTGKAQRFSWRMKVQSRAIEELDFKVYDLDQKIIYPLAFSAYGLNRDQVSHMAYHPEMCLQFADFLKRISLTKHGMKHVMVKATVRVGLNGRKPQFLFDPELDLTQVKEGFLESRNWILPLKDRESGR